MSRRMSYKLFQHMQGQQFHSKTYLFQTKHKGRPFHHRHPYQLDMHYLSSWCLANPHSCRWFRRCHTIEEKCITLYLCTGLESTFNILWNLVCNYNTQSLLIDKYLEKNLGRKGSVFIVSLNMGHHRINIRFNCCTFRF